MTNRRHFLRQLAAAGLLGNLSLLTQKVLAAGSKPPAPGIYRVSGEVTINGKPAVPGMLVRPGDTVVTGANSEAIYVVGQDAYLQRSRSSVRLLGETVTSGLRILTGKLLSVFGKGEKNIQTGTATIGIRGTGCYIEAEAERMYICLCYGEADYLPTVAPEKAMRLKTTHHESPMWISATDKNIPISKAPMMNHSDAELTLLESLVGREPPFAGKGLGGY